MRDLRKRSELRRKVNELFRSGADTMEIAKMLSKPEFVVYNLLRHTPCQN